MSRSSARDAGLRVPQSDLPPGWSRPRPEALPKPTVWPVVGAFATILIVWGAVTTWVMTGVGVALCIVAFSGWIRELLREE